MVRKSTGWTTGSGKQEKPPAARNFAFEQALCQAIAQRVLVLITYEGDFISRTFAPHAVYYSTADKVNVFGIQIDNPADPLERHVPRMFEVGRIVSLSLTAANFQPDARYNRFDSRYQYGVICGV